MSDLSTTNEVILILGGVVGLLTTVAGLGLFVMWIKYSWIKRSNSQNYTGADLTNVMFQNEGQNYEIRSSFFYLKFWNHNKRRNTYKLRPWTHDRRSVWTMMEASQQAYASIIREKHPKTFWTAFRLPRLVSMGGAIIGVGIMVWGIKAAVDLGSLENWNFEAWLKVSIGISVVLVSVAYATVYRAYVLKKNVVPLLEKTGLNQYELDSIQKIFNWALVYAIANAIWQTIRIVGEVLDKSGKTIRSN